MSLEDTNGTISNVITFGEGLVCGSLAPLMCDVLLKLTNSPSSKIEMFVQAGIGLVGTALWGIAAREARRDRQKTRHHTNCL